MTIRLRTLFNRFLRHRLTGAALIFILSTAVLAAAAMEIYSYTDLSKPVCKNDVSEKTIDTLTQPAPQKTLEAPPQAQLDGSQVNPFLMGVVGKENTPQAEAPPLVPVFDRERVLTDADGRIDRQFEISSTLKDRVGFWFDVYSKYDQNHRIIHHQKFPWIILQDRRRH